LGDAQEPVELVRQAVDVTPSSGRHFDERMALRFPRAVTSLYRLLWRLPPQSRLRRVVFRRAVRLGLEALNRRDYDAAFANYDPHVELILEPRLVGLGFDRVYRGREERVRLQQRWFAEWGDFRFAPKELIDLGDRRILVFGHIVGSGLSSGAAFDSDWALLLTASAGARVIREEVFFDRDEALETAGLSG
jgi:ketosteroid isomerase-like protein